MEFLHQLRVIGILYLSIFWKELFWLEGTQLSMSMTYHPETDRQTEVLNRILETYLQYFSSEQPKVWLQLISWLNIGILPAIKGLPNAPI